MVTQGRAVLVVDTGARLARLLREADALLIDLAAAEAGHLLRAGGAAARLPAPLAGGVALAALYRLSEALNEQLHRLGEDTEPQPAHPIVRLAGADLDLLAAAATTLDDPGPGLAQLLGERCTRRDNPNALARLLALLHTVAQVPRQTDQGREQAPGHRVTLPAGPRNVPGWLPGGSQGWWHDPPNETYPSIRGSWGRGGTDGGNTETQRRRAGRAGVRPSGG